jgi:hypothetical protein
MMDVCEESMWRGIAAGKNGAKLSDIGHAIEEYTKSQGAYGILQEYGGHGIGTEMHQEPHVLNFGKPGNGPVIVPGFVLAIEPMITRGSARTKVLGDDWTVVSADKSRGSHFEHTYAVMPDGKPFVLTAFDGGKSELSRLGVVVSELLLFSTICYLFDTQTPYKSPQKRLFSLYPSPSRARKYGELIDEKNFFYSLSCCGNCSCSTSKHNSFSTGCN